MHIETLPQTFRVPWNPLEHCHAPCQLVGYRQRFELLLIFRPTKMKDKWMGFVPTLALFNFENLHSWHRAHGVGSHFGSSINTVKKSALVLASWCNPLKSPWLFTTGLQVPLKSILQFMARIKRHCYPWIEDSLKIWVDYSEAFSKFNLRKE